MSAYDFVVKGRDGKDVDLSQYKGDVALIVNTATGCGFTPQYTELEELYKDHKDEGFTILDFPCNQFGNQAPGSDEEIHEFCTVKFGTEFPQFAKIDVLGENEAPIFKYLTEHGKFEGLKGGPMGLALKAAVKAMDKDYKNNDNIKWNFTKFLVDRDGNVVKRFEPTVPMKEVRKEVEALLNA